MGTCVACCGHEVTHEQMMKSYWWRGTDIDHYQQKIVDVLVSGTLCEKCVKSFGAVQAFSYEEAMKILEVE